MTQKSNEKQLAISVENVGVAYLRRAGFLRKEKFWALKDVSFDVFHGETLGIIGRNGVGKSTLLRLLAGIISPDSGGIITHGVSASLLSLQIGFIGHLTGRENAILSGMMLGLSKSEMIDRMDEIRSYTDIGDFFDQPVRGYSSGMRARLGFSVTTYANPDVILLDEVLGVGDADFRKKSALTMREKIKSNKTVVLVSHQKSLIMDVCDRVVWIDDGYIQAAGDAPEVMNNYTNNLTEGN